MGDTGEDHPSPPLGQNKLGALTRAASAKKVASVKRNLAGAYPPARLGTVDEGGGTAGSTPGSADHSILEID